MTVKEMVSKLRAYNPKFRFVPGALKASGLYLFDPTHEDAHENGLRWVAALPSPSFFSGNLYAKDFYFIASDGTSQYMRGWHTVVRMLEASRTITRNRLKMLFGSAWCR